MSIIESEFRSVILSGFILSTPFIFASDNSAFILSFIPDSSMSFCSAFVFTFHNVSINTETEKEEPEKYTALYIPQCFY